MEVGLQGAREECRGAQTLLFVCDRCPETLLVSDPLVCGGVCFLLLCGVTVGSHFMFSAGMIALLVLFQALLSGSLPVRLVTVEANVCTAGFSVASPLLGVRVGLGRGRGRRLPSADARASLRLPSSLRVEKATPSKRTVGTSGWLPSEQSCRPLPSVNIGNCCEQWIDMNLKHLGKGVRTVVVCGPLYRRRNKIKQMIFFPTLAPQLVRQSKSIVINRL